MYTTGNMVYVVDKENDTIRMVKWDQTGSVTTNKVIYKGWVAGTFLIRQSNGEFALAIHVPYGAPQGGGAQYYVFSPSHLAKPLTFTTPLSSFSGERYTLNSLDSVLYESRYSTAKGYIIDGYSLPNGAKISVNGKSLQASAAAQPLGVQMNSQGNVAFFTVKTTDSKRTARVVELNPHLQPVFSTQVTLPTRYAQNVQMTIGSQKQVNLWEVYSDNGQAMLSETVLNN